MSTSPTHHQLVYRFYHPPPLFRDVNCGEGVGVVGGDGGGQGLNVDDSDEGRPFAFQSLKRQISEQLCPRIHADKIGGRFLLRIISRQRNALVGLLGRHGRLEASLREGWPCSQQTKCMAVFYDAYRY